jgi:hypothetical protein
MISSIGRIGLVDGGHHLFGDGREPCLAAVMVPHHARRGRRGGVEDEAGLVAHPRRFAGVVVNRQMDAGHERQIGCDVPVADGNQPVLHVLGVNELDVVDQVQFAQQNRADQSVEIGPGEEAMARGHD